MERAGEGHDQAHEREDAHQTPEQEAIHDGRVREAEPGAAPEHRVVAEGLDGGPDVETERQELRADPVDARRPQRRRISEKDPKDPPGREEHGRTDRDQGERARPGPVPVEGRPREEPEIAPSEADEKGPERRERSLALRVRAVSRDEEGIGEAADREEREAEVQPGAPRCGARSG